MPKKYIQLLLSINFCLTAVATATDSDAGSDDGFVIPDRATLAADWTREESNREMDTNPEVASSFKPSTELKDQFYHIWHRLGKVNEIYPSELLQKAIAQHQEDLENPPFYDESKSQQELTQDLLTQFINLYQDLEALSILELKVELNENDQTALNTQFEEICKCVDRIRDFYKATALSKRDQLFLHHQLKELLAFSQSFLAENSPSLPTVNELDNEALHFVRRDIGSEPKPFASESLSTTLELKSQFNQIWDCLDEVNTIHQSEPLQRLISHHKNTEIPYNENLEEVSKKTLDNQFIQLVESLKVCSQYQPKEELDEESAKLDIQLDRIRSCLSTIYKIYDSKKEALSKKEKAFLSNQLEELYNFSYNFIEENSLQLDLDRIPYGFIAPHLLQTEVGVNSLGRVQALLNNCKEEDSLIYPQYEYIINSQEANISNLLASSKKKSPIESQFLYFNKTEGLIEIEHTEQSEDGEYIESYTTTWKIRSADTNAVIGWQEQDPIAINKTGLFSQFSLFGEKLDFTLKNNNRNSVRANFVCKSSNENTYTILSIDYLESIVVLKNGPCLFVQGEDLKEWHISDTVVLQRHGSVTDTNNSHELINKTRRGQHAWVFLKRKW